MIKLRFFNSLGEVVFDKNGWHLTEAEGLGIPTKQISAARYANQPGQATMSALANPRAITLSGDVNLKISGQDALSKGCGVLDAEGILEVCTDRFIRRIGARCTELVLGDRNGPFRSFVVQFLCDCPYFEDLEYTENVIYERTPMLGRETVLPAMFSGRVSKGTVQYPGSAFSEPIMYLSVPEGSGTITVSNLTTGEKIGLNYDGSLYSELKVDVQNRTITDENGVLRLDVLTDDSFFDGFNLRSGENRIEAINSQVEVDIKAKLRYKVRYTEAVV